MDEFATFALYLADGRCGDDIDVLVDAEHYGNQPYYTCIIA